MELLIRRPLAASLLIATTMAVATAAQAGYPVKVSPGGWTTFSGTVEWDWWSAPEPNPRPRGDIHGSCIVNMRAFIDPATGSFTVTSGNFSMNCGASVPQGYSISADNFPWYGTTGFQLTGPSVFNWQSQIPNMRLTIWDDSELGPPFSITCAPSPSWYMAWQGQTTTNSVMATQVSTPSLLIPSSGDACGFSFRWYLSPFQRITRVQ